MTTYADVTRCCSCLRIFTKARRRALLTDLCVGCSDEIRRARLVEAVRRGWELGRAESKARRNAT